MRSAIDQALRLGYEVPRSVAVESGIQYTMVAHRAEPLAGRVRGGRWEGESSPGTGSASERALTRFASGNYRAAFVTGGQTVGGIVGAEGGAALGGVAGLLIPPPFGEAAAPAFAIVGAAVGSERGAAGGGCLANWLYNQIAQPPQPPQPPQPIIPSNNGE